MTLSKAARRSIAGLTAIVLLMCQSLALAHVCAGITGQTEAVMPQPPCHHEDGADAPPAHDAHAAQCLSSQVTSSPAALPDIAHFEGPPAFIVRAAELATGEVRLPVSEPPPLRGAPPPLSILNCCLRN